jgi:hypothetical protein
LFYRSLTCDVAFAIQNTMGSKVSCIMKFNMMGKNKDYIYGKDYYGYEDRIRLGTLAMKNNDTFV